MNLGLATFIRTVLIGMRVSLEYIIKRIERPTMYLHIALFSYIYSSHVLPSPDHTFTSMIVLIVDASIMGFILIYVIAVKSLCKKVDI